MPPLDARARSTSLALLLAAPACFTPEGGPGATSGSTSSSSSTAGSTSTDQTGTATSDTGPPTTTVPETSTEPGTSGTATSDASVTATASSTDPGSTTGKEGECGNGVVEAEEMCDDGNTQDEGNCPADCQFAMPVRYVFLTSSVYNGNFGSIDAANSQCDVLVGKELAADVLAERKFVAWLSVSGQLAPSQLGSPGGPYVLLDGTMVADDTELFKSTLSLLAPIDVDETGAHVMARANDCVADNSGVWTGTFEGGELGENCQGWTLGDPDVFGTVGSFAIPDTPWTNCSTRPCSSLFHLYCIERA